MTQKPLDTIRAKIHAKQSELFELTAAPLLPAEVESRIDDLLGAWRSDLDPDWLGRVLAGPAPLDHREDFLSTAAAGSPVKLPALLATIAGDQLRSFLVKSAAPWAAGRGGLSQHDRVQRQQALEAELFDLEVAEERLIVELENLNQPVSRRPNADPSIILAMMPEEN